MSEEVNMCNENMSKVWLQSTELLAKYKELKRKRQLESKKSF